MADLSISLDVTFSFFIGFGALIMLVNTPMIIYIYTHHHLRKQKEVVIIGFVCLADLSNATAFFFAGLHRLDLVRTGQVSKMWTNHECGGTIFAYVFIASYQLIGASTLAITIDRVIAVTRPFKYRTFTWRYAYTVLGLGLGFVSLGFFICLYFWYTGPQMIVPAMCYTSTAYIPQVWNYMLYFRQCSIAASIVMYLPIAVRVIYLRKRALGQRSVIKTNANPHRRLVRTTVLIGITLLCEILFVAIPDFFLNFNLFGLKKYEMIWYLIVLSKGIVNIFLYSFNHEDIKGALVSHLPVGIKTRVARFITLEDVSAEGPDFSAEEPEVSARERLLSISDPQRQDDFGLTGKMTKYLRASRENMDFERDRLTYEHTLVRYGTWLNVRRQVLAYAVLLFVGFIYKSHVDFYEFTSALHTINEGRHIHCCCEKPARVEYLRELDKNFNSHGFYFYIKILVPFAASLTCPLWERHISRHSVLIGSVLTAALSSLTLMFSLDLDGVQFVHVLQNLCMTSVMLISMITLTEILPYNLRFISVGLYMFVGGLATAVTTLHFYRGFSLTTLGALLSIGYFACLFVVLYVAHDSILHMNIRNKADIVEKIIRKREARLFASNPEGDIYYHTRVAKKVFEDLVYLDRDELKLSDFLKRLWRNSAMGEIVLILFQAISAGMLDYELIRFWNERFVGPYLIGAERIIGYPLVLLMIFMLRRFHRVKAISLILAATLLVASVHHLIIKFDNTNGCAEFGIVESKYAILAAIFNVIYFGLVTCNLILMLVHFMETAPSSLRMTCFMIVYFPYTIANMMTPVVLSGETYSTPSVVVLYSYHVAIIVITAFRARSKLPFSLYLFDLMPVSEREPDSEREESTEEDLTHKPAENVTSAVVSNIREAEGKKRFDPFAITCSFSDLILNMNVFKDSSQSIEMSGVSLEAGFDLFVGFGALIMIVNIPMLIFIYGHPHLRQQKEVVTIGFVCYADLINAMGYFFAGIYRLEILHSGQENDFWLNLNCTRVVFPYFLLSSYLLIGASTLTITIDRVIAVTVPLKYRTFTWRYAYGLVGSALALVSLGFLVCVYFWFTLRPSTVSILCYTSTAYGPEIWDYMISIRQYSIVASILMYIPIALRIFFLRRNSKAHQAVIRGANPHRRLVKTTVLIGFTLLCEIIFVMIPDLFLNFNLFGLKKYLFVISKGIINIFLYSFNHDDIKGALLNHLPSRMKQRLTRFFIIRDQSSRVEQSHRTQTTTTIP
uniref:G protein-coupled receptor n=1 Tax=Pristionchus pacificus TaxID=54126 RepID=A0A2A6CY25_PRIPA|eukprot:PDM83069.1 G protein-coupled receptor [Pristionchus pacificus]